MNTEEIIYRMEEINKIKYNKNLTINEFINIINSIYDLLNLKHYMYLCSERITYNFLYMSFYNGIGENGDINQYRRLKKVSLVVIDKCRNYFCKYIKKINKLNTFNESFEGDDKIIVEQNRAFGI